MIVSMGSIIDLISGIKSYVSIANYHFRQASTDFRPPTKLRMTITDLLYDHKFLHL
mgnify:CR=1 FL=1